MEPAMIPPPARTPETRDRRSDVRGAVFLTSDIGSLTSVLSRTGGFPAQLLEAGGYRPGIIPALRAEAGLPQIVEGDLRIGNLGLPRDQPRGVLLVAAQGQLPLGLLVERLAGHGHVIAGGVPGGEDHVALG